MIVQALYLVCCFLLLLMLIKRNIKKSPLKPPGLSGRYPIIGHCLKLIGDRKHAFNLVVSMSRESMANEGIISLDCGPAKVYYVLTDPDDCAKVANECLEKDNVYRFSKPFLGDGLITISDVPLWKQHRKLMSPAFRQQNLNALLVVLNSQARRLVEQFASESGKTSYNLDEYIRINSLESICMSAFGADVAGLEHYHQEYLEAANEILDIFTERVQKVWLHNDFLYNLSNLKKRQDGCEKKIRKFSEAILAKRKTEMKGTDGILNNSDQYIPLMSFLLEISNNTEFYSEEEVLYETNTMVAAGYDTTSITTTLTLMLLGSYPEIQEKVYNELQDVFGRSDRDVNKDDLLKLVYLDAVVKESVRLYPVAPLIARRIMRDVKLKTYTLKAGSGVMILLWGVNRHTIWGTDADVFRPERWLDGSLPSNPNAFGGFSLGKRACIGKTYAMMTVKTVVSHILRRFRVTSDISKLELEMHGSVRIASERNISIEERIPYKLPTNGHA